MLNFTFKLNGKETTYLISGKTKYLAYSGLGAHKNKPEFVCLPNKGPIPKGEYYIVDRESGGKLGWLRDYLSGKDEWFALYANDKKIDDYTFCEEVKRGNFRLHPEGPLGISKGCITLTSKVKYDELRKKLLKAKKTIIPNTNIKTYGVVVVS
ncbi:DUF2778 domain-containing protein [Microbulbifer thermotolerans]|uniref:DUF2778 domain-containing protein n=1 Tax=Microbulbifer thermotolerans TaxID=252514 RepID=UPI00224AE911|nr:DUF2778 domain-containing protein [Microbulbifer thermotolerans]MCX2842119.1 DUF2778 domain-containing protein [Microbulbifer thermotolerans]